MAIIVKSMSRKDSGFANVFDYMTRDKTASSHYLYHNLYARTRSEILLEFEKNAQFLAPRKNGNMFYHEIIALPELKNIPYEQQEQSLIDLARFYVQSRAPDQLAFGVVHFDKKHLHLHLMISANAVRSKKRFRLAKKQFSSLQRELEAYQINRHPHLGKDSHYQLADKQLDRQIKLNEKEFQLKARTGQNLEKEKLVADLQLVFSTSTNKTNMLQLLNEGDYQLYQSRGAWGIVNQQTGKKHRLKTLGVLDQFNDTLKRFALIKAKTKEIQRIREAQKEKNQERNRDEDGFDRDDF